MGGENGVQKGVQVLSTPFPGQILSFCHRCNQFDVNPLSPKTVSVHQFEEVFLKTILSRLSLFCQLKSVLKAGFNHVNCLNFRARWILVC